MKRLFFLLMCTALLQGCTTAGSYDDSHAPVVPEAPYTGIVAVDTSMLDDNSRVPGPCVLYRQLDASFVRSISSLDTESKLLTLNSPSCIPTISDVCILPANNIFPFGFAFQVQEVTTNGSKTTIRFRELSAEDVFSANTSYEGKLYTDPSLFVPANESWVEAIPKASTDISALPEDDWFVFSLDRLTIGRIQGKLKIKIEPGAMRLHLNEKTCSANMYVDYKIDAEQKSKLTRDPYRVLIGCMPFYPNNNPYIGVYLNLYLVLDTKEGTRLDATGSAVIDAGVERGEWYQQCTNVLTSAEIMSTADLSCSLETEFAFMILSQPFFHATAGAGIGTITEIQNNKKCYDLQGYKSLYIHYGSHQWQTAPDNNPQKTTIVLLDQNNGKSSSLHWHYEPAIGNIGRCSYEAVQLNEESAASPTAVPVSAEALYFKRLAAAAQEYIRDYPIEQDRIAQQFFLMDMNQDGQDELIIASPGRLDDRMPDVFYLSSTTKEQHKYNTDNTWYINDFEIDTVKNGTLVTLFSTRGINDPRWFGYCEDGTIIDVASPLSVHTSFQYTLHRYDGNAMHNTQITYDLEPPYPGAPAEDDTYYHYICTWDGDAFSSGEKSYLMVSGQEYYAKIKELDNLMLRPDYHENILYERQMVFGPQTMDATIPSGNAEFPQDKDLEIRNGGDAAFPYKIRENTTCFALCILKNCSSSSGARYVTVDYAATDWWSDGEDDYRFVSNQSEQVYTYRVADDAIFSMPVQDMSAEFWNVPDDLQGTGYFTDTDWNIISSCYQTKAWSGNGPCLFWIALNEKGEITRILQEVDFYYAD